MVILYGNIFKVTRNRLPADVRFRRGCSFDRQSGWPKDVEITLRTPLRHSGESRPTTTMIVGAQRSQMNSEDSSASLDGKRSRPASRRASEHNSEYLEMVNFEAEKGQTPNRDDHHAPTPARPQARIAAPKPSLRVPCSRGLTSACPSTECRRTATVDGAARREKKAAKTLAVVVGGFVVCWLPFFVLYVVEPFCSTCEVSDAVRSFLTWLGYANSLLNPFIYATYNRQFRYSFWRLTVGQVRACLPLADRHNDLAETRVSLHVNSTGN